MLRRALAAWAELPPAQRRLAPGIKRLLGLMPRWQALYPDDGLILEVYSRDLSVPDDIRDDRRYSWNRDYAWLTRHEAMSLLPEATAPGARCQVPPALVRRLVRCHLVDQVRGQTWPAPPESVATAELSTEVVRAQGEVIEIRLTGATRAVQVGTWSIDNRLDAPSLHEHGVETELLGHATWDKARQRFRTFELVAAGTRWGGTTVNRRADQLAPSPIGFVLRLAPEPDLRVAPSLLEAYGWLGAARRIR